MLFDSSLSHADDKYFGLDGSHYVYKIVAAQLFIVVLQATKLEYSAAGSWNDADMLQVCADGKGRTPGDGMSLSEYRVHYTVWAILASPLILGTDLRTVVCLPLEPKAKDQSRSQAPGPPAHV